MKHSFKKKGDLYMTQAVKPKDVLDREQVEELNKSTSIMNKKVVKSKIKELKKAYRNKDRQKLFDLSDEFYDIDLALGMDSKNVLLEDLEDYNNEINKNGASALNVAKIKNTEAKLGIINYKDIIHEAAHASAYEDFRILNKKKKETREILILCGTVATLGVLSIAVGVANKVRNEKDSLNKGTTTTSTLSNNTTGVSTETLNEVYESTTNTTVSNKNGYAIESINIDYSSPTRETTSKDDRENGSYVTPDATISTIRETTPNDEVTVIAEPTFAETEPVSYETSAIPTNVDGVIVDDNNDPVPTTSYIEPTGTDPLPIEPSHETISLDELMEEYDYSEARKGKAKVLSLR
jgi:hypothetical protein